MEVGRWLQVSLGIFFFGKSSQNSSKPVLLIFWSSRAHNMCILFVYTLLKVVSYDLSVLSMSVWVSKKRSLDGGWVGGVSSIKFILDFFNFAKPLST